MGILSWVVIGLVVGFGESIFIKLRGFRMLSMVLVSVVGAVLGGLDVAFLFRVPGAAHDIQLPSLLVAFAGAICAVILLRLLTRLKKPAID